MAVDYEQYQNSAEANKAQKVLEARVRLEHNLQLGPKLVELPGFFRDVYLLSKVDKLDEKPDLMKKIRQAAKHPRIRGEFVNTIKAQDAFGLSQEVLASIHVGRLFNWGAEEAFRKPMDILEAKHQQLIAEEAARRAQAEARRAEEARRRAEEAAARGQSEADKKRKEAEARKQDEAWKPSELIESNESDSPEWKQAKANIAKVWADRTSRLPQGFARETDAADKEYLKAGFSILQEQILEGSSLDAGKTLAARAAFEYLVPRIWRKPRHIASSLNHLIEVRPATNFSQIDEFAKMLIIPPGLQNLTNPPDEKQSKQILLLQRRLMKITHPDPKYPESNIDLKPRIDHIFKGINNSMDHVKALLYKKKVPN